MNHICDLLRLLVLYKGKIVNATDLAPDWLAQAKASGRFYEDHNGNAYVWEPTVKFPENKEEIDQMDKWFPLPVKLPESISNPDIFFANMKKRILEDKQKKEN